jgi:hypothetical protein
MERLEVLISGAGIAGCTLAYLPWVRLYRGGTFHLRSLKNDWLTTTDCIAPLKMPQTNENEGRFQKGWAGGPGRPKGLGSTS